MKIQDVYFTIHPLNFHSFIYQFFWCVNYNSYFSFCMHSGKEENAHSNKIQSNL